MPATRHFPKRSNEQAYRAGLILQAKPKIDCNEFGLEQGTLRFECLNELYRKFRPTRGTPVSEFICGDDLTKHILRDLDYVGVQTLGFTRSGGSGIGSLEILVQGAIFPDPTLADPVTLPFFKSGQTLENVTLQIFGGAVEGDIDSGGNIIVNSDIGATYYRSALIDYYAIELNFQYVAQYRATRPRFIPAEFTRDADGLFVIDENTKLEMNIDKVTGQLDIPDSTTITEIAVTEAEWRNEAKYAAIVTQFDQVPAGQFFSVTENATIKIQPRRTRPAGVVEDEP